MLLIIANKNYSSWSMRPWLVLEHFNIPFNEQTVLLKKDNSIKQISELSKNALGTVPILILEENDNFVIQDSLAICEYLADAYPHLNILPKNTLDRAKARSVIAQMHSSFTTLRQIYNMNIRRLPKPSDKTLRENNPKLDTDIRCIEEIWTNLLSNNKNQAYLFGDFSMADAFFAPVVTRFYSYGVEVNDVCQEYMHRIVNTPAVKKWIDLAKQENEIIHEYEV
jgi:glutathione S-transferase